VPLLGTLSYLLKKTAKGASTYQLTEMAATEMNFSHAICINNVMCYACMMFGRVKQNDEMLAALALAGAC